MVRYIAGCIECVKHESAIRIQFFHSISVMHFFQIMRIDYIDSLIIIINENSYIFHVIDYFIRFSFIFVCSFAKPEDIIRCLKIFFSLYEMFRFFYSDSETHFDFSMVRTFFKTKKISLKFSPSKSSKNIDMIEVKNRLLKSVLRKKNLKWNFALVFSTMQLNNRIIHHFDMSLSTIFLEISFSLTSIDSILFHVSDQTIQSWFTEISNSRSHSNALFRYLTYRVQIRDHIKQLFEAKKEKDVVRYNKKIIKSSLTSENMILLYQKNSEKLKFR